ncbi:hypothetical protein PHYSODRAFT_248584 [Phytophthora sojae]|uniref:Uncharacterized protein n=1 Tax=Phytophthora sojae (strain P6497) TaxID=1094619 RepID=G5AH97_PHYSP|nr:hypothetical protein PHYSODRAFT_248584 [Phytophthora sojae]EGZ05076.1 hypothetical protein PHYSODRAFT_248584 [Phytophthora sojae]|eukprot:XP_009539448.1 hypothetical protein PHYSODRAFT_248584 [Phytophthora sojae]
MDGRRVSPRDVPMTHRELLATRVLSVDAYWQELRESRSRQPREIPVPLWPGESLAQYEREFGRWLASRRLSLASMREDPVAERNCRMQFAQTRVARPGESRQPQQQQQQLQQRGPRAPSRSRELLARRVISVDAFRDEMYKLRHGFIREDDLKRPHETMSMAQYTQKFERWLEMRNVSLASLRDNPARERSLWHSFAYTRAGTSDVKVKVTVSNHSKELGEESTANDSFVY